jgi:carbon-monoxide dehydrogenase small subunit
MECHVKPIAVAFTLNGKPAMAAVKPLESARSLLREHLRMTATKAGCGQGGCGSCTILVGGEPVLSCLLPAALLDGTEVTTLEGVGTPANLHPLQEAFYQNFATQCGYCTSGMILTAKALLDRVPPGGARPSREEIVRAMSGNICRCTGYAPIIQAIEAAADQLIAVSH